MFPLIIVGLLVVFFTVISFCILYIYYCIKLLEKVKGVEKARDDRLSVGILHPFATYGYPEERVLWSIISAIQSRYPQYRIVVYKGDGDVPPEKIVTLAYLGLRQSFPPTTPVEFVHLRRRRWVEAGFYPRFPRLGVNLGGMAVATEALYAFVPDIFLDLVGLPLVFPLFKYLGGSRVCTYLTSCSPDVLYAFSNRRHYSHFRRNKYVSLVQKVTCSRAYVMATAWAAQTADLIIANSSWTEKVASGLWDGEEINVCHVYPPCPVETIKAHVRRQDDTDPSILQICSLAQFAPQDDHPLQIRSLFQLRQLLTEEEWDRVHLVFLGMCNTALEWDRVKDMEDLTKHLSLEQNVSFKLNLPYEEVMTELEKSVMAIHTFNMDPFSIGLVECMAAGVITVGHNSGATSKDITMDFARCRTAFLATDELEYAEALKHVIQMSPERRAVIRHQARVAVQRFSEEQFRQNFLDATHPLFT